MHSMPIVVSFALAPTPIAAYTQKLYLEAVASVNYMDERVEGLKMSLGPAMVKKLEDASHARGTKRYLVDPKATKGSSDPHFNHLRISSLPTQHLRVPRQWQS